MKWPIDWSAIYMKETSHLEETKKMAQMVHAAWELDKNWTMGISPYRQFQYDEIVGQIVRMIKGVDKWLIK